MRTKKFLYPLEQQLKFCQLETEVEFLLQQMQLLNQELSLSSKTMLHQTQVVHSSESKNKTT